MPPTLNYPDLAAPAGWTYVRQGSLIRLAPPGVSHASATTVILVSPLLPRHEKLPPPAELIAMAVTVEEKSGLHVSRRLGPFPTQTETGLAGVYFEIWAFPSPNRPEEHRLYVLFADESFYYGINYVATTATFAEQEAVFWATARSLQPFRPDSAAPRPAKADAATAKTPGPAGGNGAPRSASRVLIDMPPTGYED